MDIVNKKCGIRRHFIVFFILMVVILGLYILLGEFIADYKVKKVSERLFVSDNEFVRTIDCAPIIDKEGVEKKYQITFEIRSEVEGDVWVLFENGTGAKYTFLELIHVTNEYKELTLTIQPTLGNANLTEAYLAFYGEYGTGVKPEIKHLMFNVCE